MRKSAILVAAFFALFATSQLLAFEPDTSDELQLSVAKAILDLKKAVAQALNEVIKPVREHFKKNKRAGELYDFVKQIKVTR